MKKRIYLVGMLLLCQLPLMAETSEAPPSADQGIWQTAIMIGIFLIFFYFILFRPEQRRRQEAEEQRSRLKKGDRVVVMGILGTVVRIQETTLILKMYDGSKIEVLKAAVSDVVAGSEEDSKKADKEDAALSKKIEQMDAE